MGDEHLRGAAVTPSASSPTRSGRAPGPEVTAQSIHGLCPPNLLLGGDATQSAPLGTSSSGLDSMRMRNPRHWRQRLLGGVVYSTRIQFAGSSGHASRPIPRVFNVATSFLGSWDKTGAWDSGFGSVGRAPQNLGKMINFFIKRGNFQPALFRCRPGRCSGYRWGSVNPRRALTINERGVRYGGGNAGQMGSKRVQPNGGHLSGPGWATEIDKFAWVKQWERRDFPTGTFSVPAGTLLWVPMGECQPPTGINH